MQYINELDVDSKLRYLDKVRKIGGRCPYEMLYDKQPTFPPLSRMDITDYLIYRVSSYTKKQFRSVRSLDSYNQFKCKWVHNVRSKAIGDYFVILGQVYHSQRMGEKALSTWVILTKEGEIESGHCTCKAGLGETCSHIAALLFFIEDCVTNEQEKSVTDRLAYWTAPAKKKITCQPVSNINFSVPKKLKIDTPTQSTTSSPLQALDDQKFMETLRRLQSTCPDAAILKVVKPFCDHKPIQKYPPLLTSFAQINFDLESLETLQEQAAMLQLHVTKEQATALEKDTRKQSKSVLWHKHRTGRVTASKFKAVCSTSLKKPSLSLINGICNPSSFKYTNEAMNWGIDNEKNAKYVFIQHSKKKHVDFSMKESGLIINPKFPHFGASPDALISCSCCGEGVLEIKCPFSLKDATKDVLLSKSSYLTISNNVSQLKKDSAYYYQIQAQIFISEKKYCDFMLWNTQSYFIQRIYPDEDLWLTMNKTATRFFRKVILPEILGKVFTRLLSVC